ncbi:MAG: hypothetical protein HGJ94_02885 [Desulfosarcina sp.]|nr:hypothetical protein [Desulfosarcina sp.]
MTTTIFGLAMGFFAFFGPPVSSLSFAMIFLSAIKPTRIATIRLAPEAVPANAKH